MHNGWETTHLLSLHLHAHHFLHVHELVWHHTVLELSVLWVLGTVLVEHHLHVWVNVHALSWEAHLVVHHHSWELVHLLHLHAVHHWVWLGCLLISHLATHWLACSWLLLTSRSEISITMSI